MGKFKTTHDQFIIEAREIHGDLYEYGQYEASKKHMEITCKEHGVFSQIPGSHLRGRGCPLCANKRGGLKNASNTEAFVKKAMGIHGDRYGYSLVEYVNTKTLVKIICKDHGIYEQEPNSHLNKRGCPTCAGHNIDTELFLKRSREVHGNKYDYSRAIYTGCEKNVIIICRDHGPFTQKARWHTGGNGCQKCGTISSTEPKKLPYSDFIKRAREMYGDLYEYDDTTYEKGSTAMRMVCATHGDFYRAPSSHLYKNSNGCPKCRDRLFKIDFDEFVKRANEVHDDKYSYVESSYTQLMASVTIICPNHGEYSQSASNHIHRISGCPKCTSHVSKPETDYLTSVGIPDNPEYRQVHVKIKGRRRGYKVDGFDPTTNTVYEFDGDFWHGNPEIYDPDQVNPITKNTFGYHYQKTLDKKRLLEESGYRVISMWESDWNKIQKDQASPSQ